MDKVKKSKNKLFIALANSSLSSVSGFCWKLFRSRKVFGQDESLAANLRFVWKFRDCQLITKRLRFFAIILLGFLSFSLLVSLLKLSQNYISPPDFMAARYSGESSTILPNRNV